MREMKGIQPHTRQERLEVVEQLISLWKMKFKSDLLGIAISASVARGEDQAYSDLELDVFLQKKPELLEEQYLQRVVDGMLIEAIYHTPEEYLEERKTIPDHWYLSASDQWMVVYNQPFFDELFERINGVHHNKQDFIIAATRNRYELQESFCKVLNTVEMGNREGISLLLMDAVLHLLKMLAFLNQTPFITFGRFIHQAREFKIKPTRFDELLNLLVFGSYRDVDKVGEICRAVFNGLEEIFREHGIELFNDKLDPHLPNRSTIIPE
jgi:hypothetical protein